MLKKSCFSKIFKRAQATFPKKLKSILIILLKMKNTCRENANSETILRQVEKQQKNHWLEARQDWK